MNLINSICVKDKENPIPPKMVVCPFCKKQIKNNDYICRKDILLNKKDGDRFMLERPVLNYNFYHTECNTIYEKYRKLDQLKNVLYIVFDRTDDFVDIVTIPCYVDYMPIQYHVTTLNYSFLISMFKGENEQIRLDLSHFPKFSDTFDDMKRIKRNGKVCAVYVKTYTELISVLQRVIDSIIEK